MKATPRTDAVAKRHNAELDAFLKKQPTAAACAKFAAKHLVELGQHAEQLERELASADREIERLNIVNRALDASDIESELRKEIATLRAKLAVWESIQRDA